MTRSILGVLALLAVALGTSGCTTVSATFPEREPSQVWRALLVVANTPDYESEDATEQWIVKENRVKVFDDESRIEIFRTVHRLMDPTSADARVEKRQWKFQVVFDTSLDPPTATFVSRGFGIPVQAQAEADRYFDDVRDVLSGGEGDLPAAAGVPPVDFIEGDTIPDRQPVTRPASDAQPDEEPAIDIDDLDEPG
jgi:hypothetical protein